MVGRATHQGGSVQHEDTLGVDGDDGVSILAFRNDAEAPMATADLSHTRVSADDTGRLNVNANLQVGDEDAAVGNPLPVMVDGITIVVTPTVTIGPYVAGDCVGGELTFANAARVAGGGGAWKDVKIIDDAGEDVEMELWLFSATITSPGDNNPWAPPEAELHTLVGIASTSDGAWFAAGTPSAARVEVSQRYDCAATSLFGQLVTREAPTFLATDDVTVIIGLLQD